MFTPRYKCLAIRHVLTTSVSTTILNCISASECLPAIQILWFLMIFFVLFRKWRTKKYLSSSWFPVLMLSSRCQFTVDEFEFCAISHKLVILATHQKKLKFKELVESSDISVNCLVAPNLTHCNLTTSHSHL